MRFAFYRPSLGGNMLSWSWILQYCLVLVKLGNLESFRDKKQCVVKAIIKDYYATRMVAHGSWVLEIRNLSSAWVTERVQDFSLEKSAILYVKSIIWINTEERIKGINTKYWPLDDRWCLFFASPAIFCIMHEHYNCIKNKIYVFQ